MTRVGIAGFGFTGQDLYRRLSAGEVPGLEVAFVHARDLRRLEGVPAELVLDDLGAAAGRAADLVVEAAHPDVTRRHGEALLRAGDYLPLSVTALADSALLKRLTTVAREHGHRLLLPHGALVGADSLLEWRHQWASVTITFRKHPDSLDFADSGVDPGAIGGPTVLHDGPVREVAARFPRNVNTMVTCALATVGVDACRGVLVADPSLDVAVAEIEALGRDGSRLNTRREQPMRGVSGTEMAASLLNSVRAATHRLPTMAFV